MTWWLTLSVALAQDIAFEPASVEAWPVAPHPVCGLRLERRCPDEAWTPWLYGSPTRCPRDFTVLDDVEPCPCFPVVSDLPRTGGLCGLADLFPPHAWSPDDPLVPNLSEWRVASSSGEVLTRFEGVWAVDAMPLARRLGVEDVLLATRASEACRAPDGLDCLTVLEVWNGLEEARAEVCGTP